MRRLVFIAPVLLLACAATTPQKDVAERPERAPQPTRAAARPAEPAPEREARDEPEPERKPREQAAQEPAEQKPPEKQAPPAEPVKARPSQEEADQQPEDPRLAFLRGMNAQLQRRLAGVLRELAAARETARTQELLAARAVAELAEARASEAGLRRELAKARAGLPSGEVPIQRAEPGTVDERFAPGGWLDPAGVVGRINGEPVLRGDLMEKIYINYSLAYFDPFIRTRLVEQEAARRNIHVADKECLAFAARQMVQLSAKAGSDDKLREQLAKEGKTPEMVESLLLLNAPYAIRVQKIIDQQRQSEAGQARLMKVARREYDSQYGPSVRAAHIFWRVDAPEGSPDWAKAWRRGETIALRIQEGESFAALARKESQDEESRDKGGVFGPVDRSKYAQYPVFNTELFTLQPGQLKLIRSKVGVHLLKVLERVPPALTWEQARSKILRQLQEQGATREETEVLLKSLQGSARIERLLKLR